MEKVMENIMEVKNTKIFSLILKKMLFFKKIK